jgi:hypothetical protein
VAIWNGRRARAEAIKAAINAVLTADRRRRRAEDNTLITHSDAGLDGLG